MVTKNDYEEVIKKTGNLEEIGDYQSAIALYTEIIEIDKNNPELYALRGRCYYLFKKYRHAIKDFDTAIAMKPNVPTTLFFRARAYEHLDELDKALEDYKKSGELKPEADVYEYIGLIHHHRKNYAEAINAYEKALEFLPKDEVIQSLLKEVKQKYKKSVTKKKNTT